MMNTQSDIDRLAREADEAIASAGLKRAQPRSGGPGRHQVTRGLIALLLVLPLLVLQAHFAVIENLTHLAFPTRALRQGQTDMKAMLGSAREAVEAVRRGSGALPDALPSAALAALVQYDRRGDTYRLYMSDGRSIATMDGDGTVRFQDLDP
jgi:hypothetical protein